MEKFTKQGFRLYLHGSRPAGVPECSSDVLSVTAELMEPGPAFKEADTILRAGRMNAMQSTTAELEKSIKALDAEFPEIAKDMDALYLRWAEAAGKRKILQEALDAKSVSYPKCSENQWVDAEQSSFRLDKSISNHAFSACIKLDASTDYRNDNGPVWYVTYWVATNFNGNASIFKMVDRKRFTNEASARKYIDGRIEYLEKKYFYSLDPVIPLENRNAFLVHGLEVPGYTYEKSGGKKDA